METYGRLGLGALKVLHSARHCTVECNDRLRGWAGETLFARWLSQLSSALVTSLFEAYRASLGDTEALTSASGAPL
eukprot:8602381-Karenia_brevis.AAC.1